MVQWPTRALELAYRRSRLAVHDFRRAWQAGRKRNQRLPWEGPPSGGYAGTGTDCLLDEGLSLAKSVKWRHPAGIQGINRASRGSSLV